jgi:uncharacterized membrane protein
VGSPGRSVLVLVALLISLIGPSAYAADPLASEPAGATPSVASTPAATSSPIPAPTDAALAGPIVRGVFFFSPTCPHCEAVIADHLPGIYARFGGSPTTSIDESLDPADVAFYLVSNGTLQLLMVDVSVDAGARLFVADSERSGLDQSVPRMSIADRQLVGSVDIPEQLPGIIEAGLAADGLDWPPVPDLAGALAPFPEAGSAAPSRGTTDAVPIQLPAASVSVWERVTRDPLGNGIAIIVLVILVGSLIGVPLLLRRGRLEAPRGPWRWLVPLLAVCGIAISGYLGYVESNRIDAVCGPVGDCNAVQDSDFALLGGVLPTWVLGIAGYSLILAGWIVARLVQARTADLVLLAMAAVAYGGTLFSAWLTFLEPFVIGATCMWCVLSALTMMSLLWLTAADGSAALRRLAGPRAAHASS